MACLYRRRDLPPVHSAAFEHRSPRGHWETPCLAPGKTCRADPLAPFPNTPIPSVLQHVFMCFL